MYVTPKYMKKFALNPPCSRPPLAPGKMADGKKPQKGGKKLEVNTAFEIPDDIYAGYCTPDEATHGKETKNERKGRIQKIE